MRWKLNSKLLEICFTDNFAGGGGASQGIEQAIGRAVDIAVNHDQAAITMHKANHPATKHYREDVFHVDPVEATKGKKVAYAWFSPDCKHFSKAKGSALKDRKIRGLAWVVCRWAGMVHPDVIVVENVEEFTTWGPLKKGKPIKARSGETFEKWKRQICDLGYKFEYRILNAADYGAPTKRERFVGVFRCDGKPIQWPEQRYAKRDSLLVAAGQCKPWKSAGDYIDFSIPMQSIFDREKPLVENTLKRIARGIRKFVLECDDPYIVKDRAYFLSHYYGTQKEETRGSGLHDPISTIPTNNRFALVSAFISKYYGGNYTGAGKDLSEPIDTITTVDHNALVLAHLSQWYSNDSGQELREPHPTIMTNNKSQLVAAFLTKYYGNEKDGQNLQEPLGTITAKDRFGLVTVHGIEYQITDICLRMLTARELARLQGFPEDYILDCVSETEAKAKIGNSVCPDMAEAVTRALIPEHCVSEREIA